MLLDAQRKMQAGYFYNPICTCYWFLAIKDSNNVEETAAHNVVLVFQAAPNT